jgi:hypothetical protein
MYMQRFLDIVYLETAVRNGVLFFFRNILILILDDRSLLFAESSSSSSSLLLQDVLMAFKKPDPTKHCPSVCRSDLETVAAAIAGRHECGY